MEHPVVTISGGRQRGIRTESRKGDTVFAFLGIPFAKPPIGELRFKAPLPAEPWNGIRDATKDGSPCFQGSMHSDYLIGSEDCLYLNVFTRRISTNEPLKPVIVYIHGGAFQNGSNSVDLLSPNFLMTEDIVFVSINYRLGVLGFLSLSDPTLEVPGNAGLKDQLLALKWVQKNVKFFGGDPNNVTISGTSAGSASVNYHILSPASRGLFHRAILQSGSVLNPWPHLHPKALDIMKYFKSDCKTEAQVLDLLRSLPVGELVGAQNQLEKDLVNSTFRSFAPCIEKPNPTAFLTRRPIDIITAGDYNKVPMLISYDSNEGLYLEIFPEEAKKIHDKNYIPPQTVLPENKVERERLLEGLREVYNSKEYKDNKYLPASDSMFISGIVGLAQNLANTCPFPIYLCKFDVIGSRNMVRKIFAIDDSLPGAAHGDDLGYIFDCSFLQGNPIEPGSLESITIERYVKFWTNFAKYGNPTPDRDELKFVWQPVTKNAVHYLHFSKELVMKTNPEAQRIRVWSRVYNSHEDTKNFIPSVNQVLSNL